MIAKYLNSGAANGGILQAIIAILLGIIVILGGFSSFLISYEAGKIVTATEKATAAQIKTNQNLALVKRDMHYLIINVDNIRARLKVVENIQKIQGARIGHYTGDRIK